MRPLATVISTGQIDAALHECFVPRNEQTIPLVARKTHLKKSSRNEEVRVRGVGDLLTTMASCCKPVPGDDLIGFITRGQGVVVHRQDCVHIINLERVKAVPKSIEFNQNYGKKWGEKARTELSGHGPGPSYDSIYMLASAFERAKTVSPMRW